MSEPRLQGWECPGCNLVYAPGVLACWRCGCSHPAVWQPASEPASEPIVALARIRELCCEGHGDDLIAEVADAALAAARGDTP